MIFDEGPNVNQGGVGAARAEREVAFRRQCFATSLELSSTEARSVSSKPQSGMEASQEEQRGSRC